jgi:hypothetical protein
MTGSVLLLLLLLLLLPNQAGSRVANVLLLGAFLPATW